MKTTINNLDDGSVEVIVEADGFEPQRGVVSSHHLVETKERQMQNRLYLMARQAFMDREGIAS